MALSELATGFKRKFTLSNAFSKILGWKLSFLLFFIILFNFSIFFEINLTRYGQSFFLKTFKKIIYNSDCLEIKVVKGCY